MNSVVDLVSAAFSWAIDLLLWPFSSLAPIWGLLFISALSGVVLLYLYGLVSSQEKIRAVKREIGANLLESVLYRHDLALTLTAQRRLLGGALKYFLYAVPALVVLLVPCLLLLAQLNLRFGSSALQAGNAAILRLKLTDQAQLEKVSLLPSAQMEISEPLRVAGQSEIMWRIKPAAPGTHLIKINFEALNQDLNDTLYSWGAEYPRVFTGFYRDWLERLLYPAKPLAAFSAFPVQELSLQYPVQHYSIFGFRMHWLLVFFLVSLLSGLVASRVMGVEI